MYQIDVWPILKGARRRSKLPKRYVRDRQELVIYLGAGPGLVELGQTSLRIYLYVSSRRERYIEPVILLNHDPTLQKRGIFNE